jgi:WD40 repeat protein
MGIVYHARQVALDRQVALKMILAGPHADAEERTRFRTEAEAVARLQHPHIVQIFEVGEHEGRPFFSMEYVSGGSLAQHLTGQPQSARDSARLIETLARAMDHAHERGIIHRDLKPANVLLSFSREPRASASANALARGSRPNDGTPKITDFGLAKRLPGEPGASATGEPRVATAPGSPAPTHSGAVLGTPSYMAPEQAAGKKLVGPAADVYALGAILYELLTGRPPFRADSPMEVFLQVLQRDPVPPMLLQGSLPYDLQTICLKCLEKDPGRRYPSAQALADDLRRFFDGRPILARPVGVVGKAVRWCRRQPLAAGLLAGLLMAILAGLAGVTWKWLEADDARAVADARALDEQQARGLAQEQTRAAEKARRAERERSRELEQVLYRFGIQAGQRELTAGQLVAGERFLDGCPIRLRRWEWYYLKRLCACERLTLRGPADQEVAAVAFSPDGRRVAAATGNMDTLAQSGTVILWDANTGQEVIRFQGHTLAVRALAFSPDGRWVASGGLDGIIKIWDAVIGREKLSLSAHEEPVTSLAFDPDGKRLASGSYDRTVKIWSAASGARLFSLRGHRHGVNSVAFSADRKYLATTAGFPEGLFLPRPEGAEVKIWSAASGRLVRSLPAPGIFAANGVFNLDSSRVAALVDKSVLVWDPATGKKVLAIKDTLGISGLAFSPDGKRLAAGTRESVTIWDAVTGREVQTYPGHSLSVTSVAYDPRGTRLASGSDDGTVKVWDATSNPQFRTLRGGGDTLLERTFNRGHHGLVMDVAFGPHDHYLASASMDRALKVWDLRTGRVLRTFAGRHLSLTNVAFSPDGKYVASGGLARSTNRGEIMIWNVKTGKAVHSLDGHALIVLGVAFSPDGTRLASTGRDRLVKIWDLATGKEVWTLPGHEHEVIHVAFRPDGRRLASASIDGTVRVWDLTTGRQIRVLTEPDAKFRSVVFHPAGRLLLTTSGHALRPGVAQLWDLETGRVIRTLGGHQNLLSGAVFNRDGSRIATASADGTVKLWDTQTGEELLTLSGRIGSGLGRPAFSPTGRLLAAGGMETTADGAWQGVIQIWDATPVPNRSRPRAGKPTRTISNPRDHNAILLQIITIVGEKANLLAGVSRRADLQAILPRLENLDERQTALVKKYKALSVDEISRLHERYGKQLEAANKRCNKELDRIKQLPRSTPKK